MKIIFISNKLLLNPVSMQQKTRKYKNWFDHEFHSARICQDLTDVKVFIWINSSHNYDNE